MLAERQKDTFSVFILMPSFEKKNNIKIHVYILKKIFKALKCTELYNVLVYINV